LGLGNDYLRIYSISELGGKTEVIEQGTFIVSKPNTSYRRLAIPGESKALITGDAKLYSLLQLLEEQTLQDIISIPAGTNAINKAVELVQSVGLPVFADPSAYTLNVAATFDVADSNLDSPTTILGVINKLLAYAGFASADVDGHGNVILKAYIDPSSKTPTVVFEDNQYSIIGTDPINCEFDTFFVPNQVRAICSNAEGYLVATSTNSDPQSAFSTVSRGRVIPVTEVVNDIADQAALQAYADRKLADKTSAVERFTWTHKFIPFTLGDGVGLKFMAADLVRNLVSVNKTLTLEFPMNCQTTGRRFVL
jgi:hypothetical protein